MTDCRNCDTCVHCWRDNSVGDRECLVIEDFETDEEVVEFYEDMGDNCPHYKSEPEQYQDFLQAVVDTDYFGKTERQRLIEDGEREQARRAFYED